jgi:F0F1-type ATP synthase membrane subunit c/vacuolar-type H+-ATPase subunit K
MKNCASYSNYIFNIILNTMKNTVLYVSLVAASKYIGAGVAVSGVIGAGAGIGIIFAGYMIAVSRIRIYKTLY